jgi:hypothetical protein
MLELPGLLGYAVPPSGILKLPVYRTPLISAAMLAVGALFVAVFVCKFACAFRHGVCVVRVSPVQCAKQNPSNNYLVLNLQQKSKHCTST